VLLDSIANNSEPGYAGMSVVEGGDQGRVSPRGLPLMREIGRNNKIELQS